jgi:hypothetical protein
VRFLEGALARFAAHGGVVEHVMTDNGPPSEAGCSHESLQARGLQHTRTRPSTLCASAARLRASYQPAEGLTFGGLARGHVRARPPHQPRARYPPHKGRAVVRRVSFRRPGANGPRPARSTPRPNPPRHALMALPPQLQAPLRPPPKDPHQPHQQAHSPRQRPLGTQVRRRHARLCEAVRAELPLFGPTGEPIADRSSSPAWARTNRAHGRSSSDRVAPAPRT